MKIRVSETGQIVENVGAWMLGALWLLPVVFAFWSAFHPAEFSTNFQLFAPVTLDNFVRAWSYAPFPRYLMNTFILVTLILGA